MGRRQIQDLKELCKRGTQIEVLRRCHVFSRMSCVGIWISSSLDFESRVIPTSAKVWASASLIQDEAYLKWTQK